MDDASTRKDVKVVMLGDSGAGKSSILTRFFDKTFDDDYAATIGMDFKSKTYVLEDASTIRLQLWDTAGQERFRQLTSSFIRGAAVAVIVFDLTEEKASETLKRWVEYVHRQQSSDDIMIVIVGNKADLTEKRSECFSYITSLQESQQTVLYMETSAKSGQNVEQLFSFVAHLPFPEHKKSVSESIRLMHDNNNKTKNTSSLFGCC